MISTSHTVLDPILKRRQPLGLDARRAFAAASVVDKNLNEGNKAFEARSAQNDGNLCSLRMLTQPEQHLEARESFLVEVALPFGRALDI